MTELRAIRKSIKHWMLDIVRQLKEGDTIGCLRASTSEMFNGTVLLYWISNDKKVQCYASDCNLCILHEDCCWACSLERLVGEGCGNSSNTPYGKFYENPCLATAKDMVCTLVCTYWAEIEEMEKNKL